MSTYTANEILERLRALGACGDAARPEPTLEGERGWVVAYLSTHPPDLRDLWHHAVAVHLADAWWLAWRLGLARTALTDVVRRALTYSAEAAEAGGLGGSSLRRVSEAEVLDHKAAEAAAEAVRAGAEAARATADAAAWVADAAAEAADAAAEATAGAGPRDAAAAAARAAAIVVEAAGAAAEAEQQREDLLALWPEVERAFCALEAGCRQAGRS